MHVAAGHGVADAEQPEAGLGVADDLLRPDGSIDAERFPNFAKLASISRPSGSVSRVIGTWSPSQRNTSSNTGTTTSHGRESGSESPEATVSLTPEISRDASRIFWPAFGESLPITSIPFDPGRLRRSRGDVRARAAR